MQMYHDGVSHWFLKHESGMILDATVMQFNGIPDYSQAVGRGFQTLHPSKKAAALMRAMLWKEYGLS